MRNMLERVAYTFTGQGPQRVGMWQDLEASPAAGRIFQRAEHMVPGLSGLCLDGPKEKLMQTINAQPAIIAKDLAALAAAKEMHPELMEAPPVFTLGHSVGELAALVAAGVFDEKTGIYLAVQRGLIMQEWGGKGAMAVLSCEAEEARNICKAIKEHGDIGVEAVNLNSPHQTVISGVTSEVEKAIAYADDEAGVGGIILPVSHAFHHSILMRDAQERFREVLERVEFRDPKIPVILNVTAQKSESGEEIKRYLGVQIASPVRWYESVLYALGKGVNVFIEFGPRAILTGILEEINPNVKGICVKDFESAQSLSF